MILPEGDADLFRRPLPLSPPTPSPAASPSMPPLPAPRRALLDAIFYGYVWLLEEVKAAVIDHLGLPAAKAMARPLATDLDSVSAQSRRDLPQAIMATYNRAHPGKPMRARKKREKARLFDVKWASLDAAFDPATGCLPSLFFRKADAAHAAKATVPAALLPSPLPPTPLPPLALAAAASLTPPLPSRLLPLNPAAPRQPLFLSAQAAAAARWSSVQHETCPSRGQPALLKALDAVRGAAAASAARDEDSPPPPTPPPPRPPPPPPPCSQGKGCRPRERLPLSPLEEWAHFMADYD